MLIVMVTMVMLASWSVHVVRLFRIRMLYHVATVLLRKGEVFRLDPVLLVIEVVVFGMSAGNAEKEEIASAKGNGAHERRIK